MKFGILRFFKPPVLILVAIVAFHLFLISKTFAIDSFGNMRAASAGYGDIPFHMTQVSKFAYAPYLNFNEPIFDGERLRYSFLINAISGLVLKISHNWFVAMQIPSMIFIAIALVLTYLSYKKLLRSAIGATVAVVIFLFGSGFGANWHIRNFLENSSLYSQGFIQYLVNTSASTITRYDAVYPEQNIVWGAPLSLVFLHQRSFFFGFFIFSIFWFLLQKWQKKPNNRMLMIFIGVIAGMGPLGHYHSFVVMCVVLVSIGLSALMKKDYFLFRRLLIIGLIVFLLAIGQIIYLVQGREAIISTPESFIKFRLGWMTEPGIGSINFEPHNGFILGTLFPFLNFLQLNFGIVLPIFIIVGLTILQSVEFRRRFGPVILPFFIGSGLFIIVQLIRFQPWDYDDNKILVYFQFFAAPVIVAFFLWICKKREKLGTIVFLVFTTLAVYSGIIDQIPRLMVPSERLPVIFSFDATATAEFIKKNIPYDEKIITTSTHLNPVSSLAGRPVFVGYPGWLWTRGLRYKERENSLELFFKDPISNISVADTFNARYVLIDPTAIYDWQAQLDVFDRHYELLYRQGQFNLYKLY